MSEDTGASEPLAPLRIGKAGRNEQRKATAGLVNNVSAAWLIAALVQPALALARDGREFGVADAAAAAIFVTLGVGTHVIARWLAAKVED